VVGGWGGGGGGVERRGEEIEGTETELMVLYIILYLYRFNYSNYCLPALTLDVTLSL
jgi:hypothetical protein